MFFFFIGYLCEVYFRLVYLLPSLLANLGKPIILSPTSLNLLIYIIYVFRFIHLGWIHLLQDGFILLMDCYFSYIRSDENLFKQYYHVYSICTTHDDIPTHTHTHTHSTMMTVCGMSLAGLKAGLLDNVNTASLHGFNFKSIVLFLICISVLVACGTTLSFGKQFLLVFFKFLLFNWFSWHISD